MDDLFVPHLAHYLYDHCESSVFRFNFSGTAGSSGQWGLCRYEEEVSDISDAIAHLSVAFGLTCAAIIGHSKGACEVLMYAAKFTNIPHVIAISARFFPAPFRGLTASDIERIEQYGEIEWRKDKLVTRQCLRERDVLDMKSVVELICTHKSSRVLMLHAEDDAIVPFSDFLAFQEEFGRKSGDALFVSFKLGGHSFLSQSSMNELFDVINKFVFSPRLN